jgi:probable phosphoglycerate mutase
MNWRDLSVTRLYLIRHGQTAWNREERFRGRADLEMEVTGYHQAEAIADRLAGSGIRAIYSSPMKRAVATAEITARRLGLQVQVDTDFHDLDFGEWEGLSPQEAAARDPAMWDKWVNQPHLVKFPGGEDLQTVRQRLARGITRLVKQHTGGAFAIVSHRLVSQLAILHLLDMDNAKFWRVMQDVACINTFDIRGDVPIAVCINETCHLTGIATAQMPPYHPEPTDRKAG